MAPISTILTQYELMRTLCRYLSSADIVHLAATSKLHLQSISPNATTLRNVLSQAQCDGLGLVAQARLFGYTPSNEPRVCSKADALPCAECGAKVCNNCRFHLFYPDKQIPVNVWEDFDLNESEKMTDGYTKHIAGRKVDDIIYGKGRRWYCHDCEPLLVLKDHKKCRCFAYGRFINRWLCIPCFLVEEAAAANVRIFYSVYDPTSPRARNGIVKEFMCQCGKLARRNCVEMCHICGGFSGWSRKRSKELTDRFLAALGGSSFTNVIDDADDEMRSILAQLG